MTRPLAVSLCLSLCTLALSGCSSGGSTGSTGGFTTQPISVSVTPNAATLDGGDSITLTAAVANNPNNDGVSWTVDSPSQGTLSNATKTSVTYTAPAPASGLFTANVTAASVADSTKTAVATISIPAALAFSGEVNAIVGAPLSVQLKGSGGIPPYGNFTVSSGLPPCLTLSPSGLLTSINGAVPTGSCVGDYAVDVQFTDSGTPTPLTSPPGELTLTVARPNVSLTGNVPSTATVGTAYTGGSITATGAAGAVTYAVTTGALPDGLSLNASTGAITGTPTTAGIFNFFITGTDAYGDTAGLPIYQITVNATNPNVPLKGTYACLANGMTVNNNPGPWSAAFSFTADGQGNITTGVEDINEAPAVSSNTLTGTYTLATGGAGIAAIIETSTTGTPITQNTRNWALFVQPSASPITHFRMLETDGALTNGAEHIGSYAAARCFLTDPTAFTASTLNHSFVFALRGQYAPGSTYEATAEATAGRFDAPTGAIANGYLEDTIGGDASPAVVTFTGSFSAVDPNFGRTTATFTRSYHNATTTQTLALYFIDATRALAVDISAWNGIGAVLSGELRLQKQSSWSAANVSGPFVLSTQGSDLTDNNGNYPVTGAYSQILLGSTGGNGDMTLNRTLRNDSGAYTVVNSTSSAPFGFDTTNPGRATLLLGATPVSLYFYDNNEAFELSGSASSVELGSLQPQTQTTYSYASLAGTYVLGSVPPITEQIDLAGVFTFNSSGAGASIVTVVSSSGPYVGQSTPLTTTPDGLTPNLGTFTFESPLPTSFACAALTSTSLVCIPNNGTTSPYLFIGQQ